MQKKGNRAVLFRAFKGVFGIILVYWVFCWCNFPKFDYFFLIRCPILIYYVFLMSFQINLEDRYMASYKINK